MRLILTLLVAVAAFAAHPALALDIQEIASPAGIDAWLVEEASVPVIALSVTVKGGSAQDPAGKEGATDMMAALLTEGAGDLDATAFQVRLEELAVKMRIRAHKDRVQIDLKTLPENRDEAFRLLGLALSQPRFDADAIDRVRTRMLVSLAAQMDDPGDVAQRRWTELALAGHPYGRPGDGTEASLPTIERADLTALAGDILARDGLSIGIVGPIGAEEAGRLIDLAFAGLPETADLKPIPPLKIALSGKTLVVTDDIPQSTVYFGMPGLTRDDPDFIPAYVMNYMLGGGGFGSELMNEVREKRGLVYSIATYLYPLRAGGVYLGTFATVNDRVASAYDLTRSVMAGMADEPVTEAALEDAKRYLTGSYPLRFDTNAAIADQLSGIQFEGLGIDYVDTRNDMVNAVTVEDIARVAKRLLKTDTLVATVVGNPDPGIEGSEPIALQ